MLLCWGSHIWGKLLSAKWFLKHTHAQAHAAITVTCTAMWLFKFIMDHFYSNAAAAKAGILPCTQTQRLSFMLSVHIRPAHEHAKRCKRKTCHCLSASCMCLQPGFPQNKTHHYHWAWPSEPGNGGLGPGGWRKGCTFVLHLCDIHKYIIYIYS